MSSPASIKNHPIHPMLIAFPIGLWGFALVCDIMRLAGGSEVWNTVAFYSIAGGIIGAVAAAVPGLVDYFSIDEAEMKRIATLHMIVNLTAVVIFALNLWIHTHTAEPSFLPFLLTLTGVVLIGVGGWFGGEMVYVKGMAVQAVEELAKKEQQQQSQPRRAA